MKASLWQAQLPAGLAGQGGRASAARGLLAAKDWEAG
jgi:hypothetical protein